MKHSSTKEHCAEYIDRQETRSEACSSAFGSRSEEVDSEDKKNEDHDMNAQRGRMALDGGIFMSEVLNCVYFATGGFVLANYTK
jgi:hypothetical protein